MIGQAILSIMLTIATALLHRSLLMNRQDFLTRREYNAIIFCGGLFAIANALLGAFSRNVDAGICFASALIVLTFFRLDKNLDSKWLRGRMHLIASLSIISATAFLAAIPSLYTATPIVMQVLVFSFVMRSLQHEMHRLRIDLEVLQKKSTKSDYYSSLQILPTLQSIRDKYKQAS